MTIFRSSLQWQLELQIIFLLKSFKLWRMEKADMDLSVTGGLWGSVCMRCFTEKHLSTLNLWWRHMEKS